jgi:hypothetical protein
MSVAKKRTRQRREPAPFVLPAREWDRMTELVRMFAMTGWIANARAQSMLLISEPGGGKSELLDRFMVNGWLEFASDMTSQGLHPILKQMKSGATTHLFATEFQKFLARKSATAAATIGLLCQMMEEGVRSVRVGQQVLEFGGAQGGIIGAITHKTVAAWHKELGEFGFWSRCAAFEWEMPGEELRGVMSRISHGNKEDLEPVVIKIPRGKVNVDFPPALSEQFEDYVMERMKAHTVLRTFQRFRALAMACALLDGRTVVHARDVEKVVAFNPYWTRMVKG